MLLASYNLNLDAVRLGNMDEKIRVELVKRQVEQVHGLSRGYLDSIVESYKTIEWDHEQGFYGGISHYKEQQQSLLHMHQNSQSMMKEYILQVSIYHKHMHGFKGL